MEPEPGRSLTDPARLDALGASGLLDSAPEPSFDRLAALAARVLRAPVALVSLVDEGRQFFKAQVGLPAPTADERETPLSHSFCQHVVARSEPLVIADARQDPLVRDNLAVPDLGVVAYAGYPLRSSGGQVLGSFCVIDHVARQWSDDELAVLADLAESVNSEIALREFAAAERRSREELERAHARLAFLADANAVLSASLDPQETLNNLVRLAVPTLADWCVIDMREDAGHVSRLALAHRGADRGDAARELVAHFAPDPRRNEGVAKVLRTAKVEVVTDVDDQWLRRIAQNEQHFELLRAMGIVSALFVPLLARGNVIGVMTFVSADPQRRYDPDDTGVFVELARHAAAAVSNARLYAERDNVARTLQASLLPPGLPSIPGVELAARYHPSGRGNDVGGDFYDAFQNGSGGWVIAVGDVRGKGPAATAVTGLVRHTIRAAAMQHGEPGRVLAVLNDVLVQEQGGDDERFCTVTCLVLEPVDGEAKLTVASGGHPAPLLLRAGGELEEAVAHGPLVGMLEEVEFTETTLALAPGDAVVLYTDGVTEARGAHGFFGSRRLEELLRGPSGRSAHDLASEIEREALRWQNGVARDDIAVVVARLLPA